MQKTTERMDFHLPKPVFLKTPADFKPFEESLKLLCERYLSLDWEWSFRVGGKVQQEMEEIDPQNPLWTRLKKTDIEKPHPPNPPSMFTSPLSKSSPFLKQPPPPKRPPPPPPKIPDFKNHSPKTRIFKSTCDPDIIDKEERERQRKDDVELIRKVEKEIRMHSQHTGCACEYEKRKRLERLQTIEEGDEEEREKERETHTTQMI